MFLKEQHENYQSKNRKWDTLPLFLINILPSSPTRPYNAPRIACVFSHVIMPQSFDAMMIQYQL